MNHPETTVYNQCSNLLLDHAIASYEGKNPPPLLSIRDKKPLPPMPRPGEVDFIYGGTFPLCLDIFPADTKLSQARLVKVLAVQIPTK